jgi:hypothetical protein
LGSVKTIEKRTVHTVPKTVLTHNIIYIHKIQQNTCENSNITSGVIEVVSELLDPIME